MADVISSASWQQRAKFMYGVPSMDTTLHFESMQNNFLGECASFDNCQLIYIVKFFRLCAEIGVFVMKLKKISLAVN